MKLSVVIPTYNENENINILIPKIESLLSKKFKNNYEIIVVDDSSPDGTARSAKKLSEKYGNINVIVKKKKEGIGAALKVGYNSAKGDLILSTDADLSFDAKDMERLIAEIKKGYDLVVGSRHLYERDYEKPNLQTKLKGFISRYGNMMVRLLSGLNIHDFSANFRVIRKGVWHKLKTTDNTNSILLEMILKTKYKGYRVTEIPVQFKDRIYGVSKLNLAKESPKFFVKLVFYVLKYRILRLDD